MIELRTPKSSLRLSPTVWVMTLELARLCGWQPAGPEGDGASASSSISGVALSWQTRYSSSDGQTIGADDAANLASAIERAITQGQSAIADWRARPPSLAEPLRTPPDGFSWFTTPAGVEHLRTMAAFLRRGPVRVH